MGERAPSPGANTTGSQIHPPLRLRAISRAATFSEGAHPLASTNRRRESILSDGSDTRHSLRSSTDNLLRPDGIDMDKMNAPQKHSVWHSWPLAFAILPAVGGLLFEDGTAVVTDLLLLALATIFLNCCVRTPWDWYLAARPVQYIDAEPLQPSDTILEEDEEDEEIHDERPSPTMEATIKSKSNDLSVTKEQDDARRELRRNKILALIACFIGPLLGAYLLQAIRSQLTRPAEGLVSDYNITIFVLAAEIRPVLHVFGLKRAHMADLQRVLRPEPGDQPPSLDALELFKRLEEVETRLAEPSTPSDVETMKLSATVRQGMQPQLDALNRAVRRYEKRQTAQAIQTEARFRELEAQLQDALALAAAAARTGQRPGLISVILTSIANSITLAISATWAIVMYPFRFAISLIDRAKYLFVKPERQPRKRVKGQHNGYSPLSTPRMQSRSGR